MLTQTQHDPRVSCPIICGEYMRATGFFYRTADAPYLVTARHNLLPTNVQIPNPFTGGTLWQVSETEYLPEIDLYLHASNRWEHKRIDIREQPDEHLFSDPTVDVFAVRLPFTPSDYGYTVFTDSDVAAAETEGKTVVEFGFCCEAIPESDGQYSPEFYQTRIESPYELELENVTDKLDNADSDLSSVLGIAVDSTPTADAAYNGMSGAPVMGEGLIGIHSGTSRIPADKSEKQVNSDYLLRVHFFSLELLRDLLP